MSLVYDTRIREHLNRWVGFAHPLNTAPVRGSSAPIEQATFSQQKCASTDTGRQLRVLILLADPVQQPRIVAFAPGTLTAWHNEYIKRRMLFDGRVRLHL